MCVSIALGKTQTIICNCQPLNDGKANEAIAQNLGAGLYYLQVAGSADTTYNLGVSATALTC